MRDDSADVIAGLSPRNVRLHLALARAARDAEPGDQNP
jgi:hypothetical protein